MLHAGVLLALFFSTEDGGVPPKRLLNLSGLHDISKTELFIIIDAKISKTYKTYHISLIYSYKFVPVINELSTMP
jgi:hypothetical protein